MNNEIFQILSLFNIINNILIDNNLEKNVFNIYNLKFLYYIKNQSLSTNTTDFSDSSYNSYDSCTNEYINNSFNILEDCDRTSIIDFTKLSNDSSNDSSNIELDNRIQNLSLYEIIKLDYQYVYVYITKLYNLKFTHNTKYNKLKNDCMFIYIENIQNSFFQLMDILKK